ncbi:P-loop containing nucleoside triphosphate hydrolase protein, partial [Suillus bovinus]|uniref:P-loop containing nucleoside triphosphate hydrolase protein n=1 Tax=Suillus bovinus TaxID=48563 RepID=UPI001B86E763
LIMGRDVAQTSPGPETCTLQHTSYEVNLADRRFKLWEVSSIESMGFFRTLFTKWRLKKSYKKLYRDDGVYLLLYCIRGSRAQKALIRDYKFFTDIVGSTATEAGRVPVAAVVTSLEDYPKDMDEWWTKNKANLEYLGMRFSAHACITSLPDDPTSSHVMRAPQSTIFGIRRGPGDLAPCEEIDDGAFPDAGFWHLCHCRHDMKVTYNLQSKHEMGPSSTRNIVIFGETGAGKSSVINLLAGQQIAHISPDSHRCTLHWMEYQITLDNETRYKVFDTVGLEEPRLQTEEYLSAISNAYNLINTLKERGGINLLLFCIRGGRVTATMQSNYRLFFEFLCEEKVPLVLVVTNLEREITMEDWYTRHKGYLEKYNIRSAGHACITAGNFLDGRHREKYEESYGILRRVVGAHCNASMEGWTGGRGWLASFIRKLVEFVVGRPKRTDIIGILTKRCGMAKEVARQVAQHIKDDSQSHIVT